MVPVTVLTVSRYAIFWKISSFLIRPVRPRSDVMTVHSTAFEIEHPVPVNEVVKEAPPAFAREGKADAAKAEKPTAVRRDSLRKTLLTGAALAALVGAAWYGWNY